MATIAVDSVADPRLHAYVGLTDMALRTRREPAEGLFMAEGEKVVRRAVAAGYPLRSLLTSARWVPGLADLAAATGAPVYVAPDRLLEALTGFAVHRGALAEMGRLPLPAPAELLAPARRVVVLEDVNNHTNIGAVFRSAAALGMDAVLVNERCADPLYRRAVKVSMGAVFSVPWTRLPAGPAAVALLRAHGLAVAALTPDPSALTLAELAGRRVERLALVLGAEGPGLTGPLLAAADVRVRIPMAAGVDSLNVAAAAAVACYALGPSAAAEPGDQRGQQGAEESTDHA